MKRLILIALIACATTTPALASPVPDEAESDCSWAENGVHVFVGDIEYVCLCAELTTQGRKVVACRWYATESLPKASKKRIHAKPKPRKHAVRVYPRPAVVA